MTDSTSQIPVEKQQERLRFAKALRSVFGSDAERNDDQRMVWSWLEANCFVHETTLALTAENHTDALRMAHYEGARRIYLSITRELRWLATPPEKRPQVGQKQA